MCMHGRAGRRAKLRGKAKGSPRKSQNIGRSRVSGGRWSDLNISSRANEICQPLGLAACCRANKDAAPSPFAPSRHLLQNSPSGTDRKGKVKLRKREKRENSKVVSENRVFFL